jgi:hypothetical protein
VFTVGRSSHLHAKGILDCNLWEPPQEYLDYQKERMRGRERGEGGKEERERQKETERKNDLTSSCSFLSATLFSLEIKIPFPLGISTSVWQGLPIYLSVNSS